MIKNKLNNFDVATLNYFITRAFLTGYLFNSLLQLIRQDSWIIPLIGIIIGIIFSLLIIYSSCVISNRISKNEELEKIKVVIDEFDRTKE